MSQPAASAAEQRRRRILAWVWVAAWTALILGAGSAAFSADSTSRILGPLVRFVFPDLAPAAQLEIEYAIRKLAHVTEYGVLAALALNAAGRTLTTGRSIALALGLALTVAVLDEGRQSMLDARTGSAWDVGYDMTGASLATAALLLWRRHREGGAHE